METIIVDEFARGSISILIPTTAFAPVALALSCNFLNASSLILSKPYA